MNAAIESRRTQTEGETSGRGSDMLANWSSGAMSENTSATPKASITIEWTRITPEYVAEKTGIKIGLIMCALDSCSEGVKSKTQPLTSKQLNDLADYMKYLMDDK